MTKKMSCSGLELFHNALASSTIAYFAYSPKTEPYRWRGDLATEVPYIKTPPSTSRLNPRPARLTPPDGKYTRIHIAMEFPALAARQNGLATFPCITMAYGTIEEKMLAFRRQHAMLSDIKGTPKGISYPYGGVMFTDILWEVCSFNPNQATQIAGLVHQGLATLGEIDVNSIFNNLVRLGIQPDMTSIDITPPQPSTTLQIENRPLWFSEVRTDLFFDWRSVELMEIAFSSLEYEGVWYSVLPLVNGDYIVRRQLENGSWELVQPGTELYDTIVTYYEQLKAEDELIYDYIDTITGVNEIEPIEEESDIETIDVEVEPE